MSLGTRVVLAPLYRDVCAGLIFRKESAPIRSFLISNPMLLAEADGSLRSGYICDATRAPRLEIPGKAPGVGEPKVINLDEDL